MKHIRCELTRVQTLDVDCIVEDDATEAAMHDALYDAAKWHQAETTFIDYGPITRYDNIRYLRAEFHHG